MSAPVYFPTFVYKDIEYIDGGTGTYGVNVIPAYYHCIEDLKWKPTEFFLLSWGCGRSKIGKIGTGKIAPIAYFFSYSRQESEISTEIELKDLEKQENLKQYRWNIDLPKELENMDETNNIEELVTLVDK
jgi:hypothetical protein